MSRGLVMPGPRSLPRVGEYMSIGVGWVCISTLLPWTWDLEVTPPYNPVLTSGGGHRSGRYASYWKAFLLLQKL